MAQATAFAEVEKARVASLNSAEQERLNSLAEQKADMERQKRQDFAEAQDELENTLASQQAELEADKQEALQQAEQKRAQDLAATESALEEEKRQALEQAEQERQQELAAQKATLEEEKQQAVAEREQDLADELDEQKELLAQVSEKLEPYVQAQQAKDQIVEQLAQNFKDFDNAAVEIDGKTGQVKLHFQESYFLRGSHELSEDMKQLLKSMIPKYAKSIYETDAGEHVESLKISGLTSPVYQGLYIDKEGKTPRAERARVYNMALANKRAIAMYEFIFDEEEMGDYQFRSRLKTDMGVAALGFQNAEPVRADLIGKPADCVEYDCQREQATVLQFRMFSEN